jgi:hypothetical protein
MYYQEFNISNEDLVETVKVSVLKSLIKQDLIDEDIAEEWCENHTIIFKKKSFFKTISDKWLKEKELSGNDTYLIVVKKV